MSVFAHPVPPPGPIPPRQAVPADPSPHEPVIRAINQRLDALPATPNKIARALRGLGLRGHRDDTAGCVLCRYLAAHLPPGYKVQVSERQVQLRWPDTLSGPILERELAPEVSEFVVGFDTGQYPALEEGPSRCAPLGR